jgi:CIC family chloride channel protein
VLHARLLLHRDGLTVECPRHGARFEEKEVEILPVVDSPNDKSIIAYLTEQFALRRYNQELERRRNADLGQRDLFSIAEPPR